MYARAINKQGGWQNPSKGGDAMFVNNTIMLVLAAMTFVVVLVKLMVDIADKFSKRK